MRLRAYVGILILFVASLILQENVAYAYIDPTSGGTLYQALFLALSAGVAALVFLRRKIEEVVSAILRFARNLFGF